MDTSKATGRPWVVDDYYNPGSFHEIRMNGVRIARMCAPSASSPGEAEQAANAALIVERVNGWEALVAERDALRAKLDAAGVGKDALRNALLSTLDDMSLLVTGRCPRDLVDEIWQRATAARAALGKGA